jgi:hypothetical protein
MASAATAPPAAAVTAVDIGVHRRRARTTGAPAAAGSHGVIEADLIDAFSRVGKGPGGCTPP